MLARRPLQVARREGKEQAVASGYVRVMRDIQSTLQIMLKV